MNDKFKLIGNFFKRVSIELLDRETDKPKTYTGLVTYYTFDPKNGLQLHVELEDGTSYWAAPNEVMLHSYKEARCRATFKRLDHSRCVLPAGHDGPHAYPNANWKKEDPETWKKIQEMESTPLVIWDRHKFTYTNKSDE